MKVRIKESVTGLCKGLNAGDIVDVKDNSVYQYLIYKKGIDGHKGFYYETSEYWWLNKEKCEVVEESHDDFVKFSYKNKDTEEQKERLRKLYDKIHFGNQYKEEDITVSEMFSSQQKQVSFLPTKVIFNPKKGKTTLLFGEAPYEVYTSVASHGDEFNLTTGFYVTLLKRLYNDADRKIKLAYDFDLYYDERERNVFLEGLIFAELQKHGMSNHQFGKLVFNGLFANEIKFVINGVEHIMEIEHKEW